MAHELDNVLTFFKKFGDDNLRDPSGIAHKMSEYADKVLRVIERESGKAANIIENKIAPKPVVEVPNISPATVLVKPDISHLEPEAVIPKPKGPENIIIEKGKV